MKTYLRKTGYAILMCAALAVGAGYLVPIAEVQEFIEDIIAVSSFDFVLDEDAIQAKSVLVVDMKTDKILYARNEHVPHALASLAKIVTALVVLDDVSEQDITISSTAVRQTGDHGLRVGEMWGSDDLLQFMLITSSNDAAYAFSEYTYQGSDNPVSDFVRSMNQYVHEESLHEMYFLNPTGLDDDVYGVTGYGTARDVYHVMQLGVREYPEIFLASATSQDWFASRDSVTREALNTNIVAEYIPSLVFSKTGYTDNTGGNLAFIFERGPHHPIGVVILGSTFHGRFDDALAIVQAFQ